jgi:hypothetical protein
MEARNLWQFLHLSELEMPDENKWNLIRSYRNDLLTRCDWTQLPDNTLTDEERLQWTVYRQTLRDLPTYYETPDELIFPTAPSGEM